MKLGGRSSGNGYRYSDTAFESSLSRYEGVGVNVGHGDKPSANRSPRDRIGFIKNARIKNREPYGDLYLLHPAGEFEQRLMAAAEKAPRLFGMSHVAKVGWSSAARTVAESILDVRSVDVVLDGATTSSLFESRQPRLTRETAQRRWTGTVREAEMGMNEPPEGDDAPLEDIKPAGPPRPEVQMLADLIAKVAADTRLDDGERKAKIDRLQKLVNELAELLEDPTFAVTESRWRAFRGDVLAEAVRPVVRGPAPTTVTEAVRRWGGRRSA